MSVTCHSTLTSPDTPEVDGALISPTPHQCSVLGYSKLLKATRKGKKSKQGFQVTPAGMLIQILIGGIVYIIGRYDGPLARFVRGGGPGACSPENFENLDSETRFPLFWCTFLSEHK